MWVQKAVKSKFVKCFLIAIVLVFSYEVSKPKAFVPLAWAGAVLAGMAAETLVTMGVKAVSKEVLKRKADDYAAQALKDGKFDFMGTNPYRNKDGSISLSPTANDRAKMAGLISGALIGSMFGDSMTGACESPNKTRLPIKRIVLNPTWDQATQDYYRTIYQSSTSKLNSLVTAYKYPGLSGKTNYEVVSNLTGGILHTFTHTYASYEFYNMSFDKNNPDYLYPGFGAENTSGITQSASTMAKNDYELASVQYLNGIETAQSVNATLEACDGLIVPSTIGRIYQPPMDMSSTYKMPNDADLANKPITIYNVMPAGTTEGEITWDEIEDYYNTSGKDFQQVMDSNIDNYVAKGTINENTYTIDEINNYYTDVNYPVKVEDFNPPTGEVEVPGDNLPGEPISDLDPSMWQVMKNTYNYLDDGIDASLASMKGITDSAQGITTYLNQTMGWLPMEFRAVLTSAFVLGVFAHFLRR